MVTCLIIASQFWTLSPNGVGAPATQIGNTCLRLSLHGCTLELIFFLQAPVRTCTNAYWPLGCAANESPSREEHYRLVVDIAWKLYQLGVGDLKIADGSSGMHWPNVKPSASRYYSITKKSSALLSQVTGRDNEEELSSSVASDDEGELVSSDCAEIAHATQLSRWIQRQLSRYIHGSLEATRALRLQALPNWAWPVKWNDVQDEMAWGHMLNALLGLPTN